MKILRHLPGSRYERHDEAAAWVVVAHGAIELPTGSRVNRDAVMVTFESVGPQGECRVTAGAGKIHVEQAGPAQSDTRAGDVTVDHIREWVQIKIDADPSQRLLKRHGV